MDFLTHKSTFFFLQREMVFRCYSIIPSVLMIIYSEHDFVFEQQITSHVGRHGLLWNVNIKLKLHNGSKQSKMQSRKIIRFDKRGGLDLSIIWVSSDHSKIDKFCKIKWFSQSQSEYLMTGLNDDFRLLRRLRRFLIKILSFESENFFSEINYLSSTGSHC